MAHRDELDEVLGLLELIRGTLRDIADRDPAALDAGIDDALRTIGGAAGVDRSYLFVFEGDLWWVGDTYEWCAPGVDPLRDALRRSRAESIAWWLAPFRDGQVIHIPDVATLDEERSAERDALTASGVTSVVAVPMLTGGRLVGYLGFEAVGPSRTWSDGAILLLRAVADAICSALMRREAVDELESREARYRALVRHSSDVVMIVDGTASVAYLGQSAHDLLGWDPERRLGSHLLAAVHPRDRAVVAGALEHAALQPGSDVRVPDHRLAHVDGSWRWFLATATDLRHDAAIGGTVITGHDITSRKVVEEALQHHAMHDAMTGLPNRALLVDRLAQSLKRAARSERYVGVVFLDVDRFKLINDALGHERGDEVLVEVASRLTDHVRAGDTVARFAGDEFVLLLEEVEDHAEAMATADRVIAAFDRPFQIAGRSHVVTVSAGVVLGGAGSDPATLLQDADTAMYQAKQSGRARISTFDAPLRDELLRRVQLVQELHGSLDRGELTLEYQPLYRLSEQRIIGVEALLRWDHPERGRIGPAEFIPLAEEHGLIVRFGRFVLDRALRQLVTWDAEQPQLAGITMSVNLSVHQLIHGGLADTVRDLLETHGLPPSRLCLELTESALMEEPEAGQAVLGTLRELGVGLAIDDFGTGYSSLAYLRELPVTTLKIDRSFVTGLGIEERDGRVYSAIIRLAQEFGLAVVTEGIETAIQLQEVGRHGCTIGQGFLLQRPASAEEIAALPGHPPALALAPPPPPRPPAAPGSDLPPSNVRGPAPEATAALAQKPVSNVPASRY